MTQGGGQNVANINNSSKSSHAVRQHSTSSENANGDVVERKLTAYERLSNDLNNDQKHLKELTLGKRIGFYRIRGELGTGNFSQVKMGIHCLTKGLFFLFVNKD